MAQSLTYFSLSFCLDLPYVEVVTLGNIQKSVANYQQDNLYTLRFLGLATS